MFLKTNSVNAYSVVYSVAYSVDQYFEIKVIQKNLALHFFNVLKPSIGKEKN